LLSLFPDSSPHISTNYATDRDNKDGEK